MSRTSPKFSTRGGDPSQKSHLGSVGEHITAKYLETSGYRILAKNFRHVGFEIDLIAENDRSLCAIEVKTRSRRLKKPLPMGDFMPARKLAALSKGLTYFQSLHQLNYTTLRLDFALVLLDGNSPRLFYWKNVGNGSGS